MYGIESALFPLHTLNIKLWMLQKRARLNQPTIADMRGG
jgi:hypothetical protein